MRHAILLLLCVGLLGWCGARIETAAPTASPPDTVASTDTLASPWRCAKDGWQRIDAWPGGEILAQSALAGCSLPFFRTPLPHPLIAALLLLLSSLWLLLAFDVSARFQI